MQPRVGVGRWVKDTVKVRVRVEVGVRVEVQVRARVRARVPDAHRRARDVDRTDSRGEGAQGLSRAGGREAAAHDVDAAHLVRVRVRVRVGVGVGVEVGVGVGVRVG